MTSAKPSRGDIWLIDLNPTRGRQQAGKRPCLVTSVDLFNQDASGLVDEEVGAFGFWDF